MQTPHFVQSLLPSVAVAGALLLPSCAKERSAPTTIINVEAPKAPAQPQSPDAEIADLRIANSVDAPTNGAEPTDRDGEDPMPARRSHIEPTDRDVEDPAPARLSSSSGKSKSQLMDFYDRLPAKHFAAFGGVNRRSLLSRKGAIVDYKYNFIEIPGSTRPADGDLHKLQITLFPNGNEPWCAVSRIVWPQGQTPGALDFYHGEADVADRQPRAVAAGFFPYQLRKTDIGYESAWLPQRGLDIQINSAQDSDSNGPIFRYNRNSRVGEPAFKRVYEDEEGTTIRD